RDPPSRRRPACDPAPAGSACSPRPRRDRRGAQWPQPQLPPQQPPPPPPKAPVCPAVPIIENVESCLATLVPPHSGHTTCSSPLTSSSKCSSHFMQTYSYIGIAAGV